MPKRAVLIVNLGSPDSPSVPDVRRYLREFLGDKRVLDIAPPLRWLLLEAVILPSRPKKTAHAYSKIWTAEGSPLVSTSKRVREKLAAKAGPETPVFLAMRYGNPSIRSVVKAIAASDVEEVLLFPQYPHYAMSSWETVVARVCEEARKQAPKMKVACVKPFFADADYIDVLHGIAAPYLSSPYDHLLMSYHGIPVRHLRKADPTHCHCTLSADCCATPSPAHATCYRAQCLKMTAEFAKRNTLDPKKYSVSFQSRLAGEPWMEPFTDFEFVRLAKEGKKRLIVMCPSFVADCLETLEEISMTGQESFLSAGGEHFTMIPCPNDHPNYVDFLANRMRKWLDDGTL